MNDYILQHIAGTAIVLVIAAIIVGQLKDRDK